MPVDAYVPGRPPRPEALLEGIVLLQKRIQDEDMAARWKGEPIVVHGQRGGGERVRPPATSGEDETSQSPRQCRAGSRRFDHRVAPGPPEGPQQVVQLIYPPGLGPVFRESGGR